MRNHLRTLASLAGAGALIAVGFFLATWWQWTFAINNSYSKTHYDYQRDADGSLLRLPTDVEETTISIHSEPYRMTPVVNLFDKPEDSK